MSWAQNKESLQGAAPLAALLLTLCFPDAEVLDEAARLWGFHSRPAGRFLLLTTVVRAYGAINPTTDISPEP